MASISPGAVLDIQVSVALAFSDAERRRLARTALSGTPACLVPAPEEWRVEEVVSQLSAVPCDVIMVGLDEEISRGLYLISEICRRRPSVTVIACSRVHETDAVIRAMRAGAREFLTEPLSATQVSEALTRAALRHQPAEVKRQAGKLLIFHGTKGGSGVTTLAINFAVALQKEKAGRVILVDLHAQLGDVALGLGIVPQFSVIDALENLNRLDTDLLSTLLTAHESGVQVLASPDHYGAQNAFGRGTERLAQILRQEFDYVVVDAGSCADNISCAPFDAADSIYLVTEASIPALRNARRMAVHFAARESSRSLEIVMNQFNSRRAEIDEESAAKAISRPIDWKIPNDYEAVRAAQNLGIPLVMQDSLVSRAICRMARAVRGEAAAGAPWTVATSKGDKWKFWSSKNIKPMSTVHS